MKPRENLIATNKKSGETVTFKSKEARDTAIEAGTHTELDKNDDDTKTTQGSAFLKSKSYQKRVKKEKEVQKKIDNEVDKEKTDNKSGKTKEEIDSLRTKDSELVKTQLFLYEGDDQDAGGLGTPESRTGETVTVYAGSKNKTTYVRTKDEL